MKKQNEQIFTLMHKNIKVASIIINTESGAIIKITEILDKKHFPPCCNLQQDFRYDEILNNLRQWWLYTRTIPDNRTNINDVLELLKIKTTSQLLIKNNGLSLADQYWILPSGEKTKWEDITFFRNYKNSPASNLFVYGADGLIIRKPKINIPDVSLNGRLQKRWETTQEQHMLLKAGTAPYLQEPYNEMIGSAVAKRLGFNHVDYTIMYKDGLPYSYCKSFINENTEFITADTIMKVIKKPNHVSNFRHYLNCCEHVGIKKEMAIRAFAEFAIIDSVIANDDRHLNNFGFIRNADTLEYTSACPAFDFGNSLWFDADLKGNGSDFMFYCDPMNYAGRKRIKNLIYNPCAMPFKSTHKEQLKLLGNLEFANIENLYGIVDQARDILANCQTLNSRRRDGILFGLDVQQKSTAKIVKESK